MRRSKSDWLTNQPTNQPILYSRVLLEKPAGPQLVKEFTAFLNPKVHYRIYKSSPPVLILSQINPVYDSSHFWRTFNCTLPPTPSSSKWSVYLRFPHQRPVITTKKTTQYVTGFVKNIWGLDDIYLQEIFNMFLILNYNHNHVNRSLLDRRIRY
jgi:hypothetical protein